MMRKQAVLVVILALGGCSHQVDPSQQEQAKKDVPVVEHYYSSHTIGGRWLVTDLKAKEGIVVGELLMLGSPSQACAFKADSSASRENAISNACPREGDPVWSAIGSETDIELEVHCQGKVFYTHSCREAHRIAEPGSGSVAEVDSIETRAKHGDPLALSSLGVMYANGDDGKPHDPVKAVELYKQAATQGFAAAQLNLAMMYETGDGTAKNLMLAYGYYTLAHEYADANNLASKMRTKDVRKAQAMVSNWKQGALLQEQLPPQARKH